MSLALLKSTPHTNLGQIGNTSTVYCFHLQTVSHGTYFVKGKLRNKQNSVLFNYAGLMIHIGAVLRLIARTVILLLTALKGGHLN